MTGESRTPTGASPSHSSPNEEPEPLPLWLSAPDAMTAPPSSITRPDRGTPAPVASVSTSPGPASSPAPHRALSREAVELAASIATPVDDRFGPCRAYLAVEPDGRRVYFGLDGGRSRQYVGPAFPNDKRGGRRASDLVNALNRRLRS